MPQESREITCAHCGMQLPEEHSGPCPGCGKVGRNINISVEDGIKVSGVVTWETRREFYKKKPKALFVVILITVISPFLGLFLTGPFGVVLGLALGGLAYWLGPKAITKMIEIRHG